MKKSEFEEVLNKCCDQLTDEARKTGFKTSAQFENRVREVLDEITNLTTEEKTRLRAEAALLCPSIVKSGRSRNKYDDMVLYLLTYHGVLCHQARDLFSAGSVANPKNDDEGGIYIERALKLIENEMREAAMRMDDALFVEYWGESVPPEQRIQSWLEKADEMATGWVPSESLFLD